MAELTPQIHASLMQGVTVPERLGPRNMHAAAKAQWADVVEVLMSRGVRSPAQLGKLLGIGATAAKGHMARVADRWQAGLDQERLNWRRESLYGEADAVAMVAFGEALDQTLDPKARATFLRVVIEANRRKAALCGLDSKTLTITATSQVDHNINIVAKVEEEMGIPSGALADIGRSAAMLMSGQQLAHLPETQRLIDTHAREIQGVQEPDDSPIRVPAMEELPETVEDRLEASRLFEGMIDVSPCYEPMDTGTGSCEADG